MIRSPSWTLRAFVAALTLGSLAHVGVLFPRFFTIQGMLPPQAKSAAWAIILTIVTAVGACILALVLVVRSWDRPGARSLALFLAFLASVWGSLLRFLHVDVGEGQVDMNLSAEGLPAFFAIAGFLFSVAAFIRFSALFPVRLGPDTLPPPRRLYFLRRLRLQLLRPGVVWGLAAALVLLQGAGSFLFISLAESGGLAGRVDPTTLAAADVPFLFWVSFLGTAVISGLIPLAGIGLGVRNLVSGYRLAATEDRRRVLWLVAGVSSAGWMVLGGLGTFLLVVLLRLEPPGWVPGLLLGLPVFGPAVLVATTGVALFYSGAVDPGLILKRSTVLGALGALGILLFAGLEEALSELVASRMGLPGIVGSIFAGAVAAGVMIPMRKAVGKAVARVLPGQEGG